jgi:2',3'-cyclic-nucleotide 2'-phosphodiesterase / 3'-nucleotidase
MIELVILATTDLHANLKAYDYYKDTPVEKYGLSKVASLIASERAKSPQAVLVDAGDFFQGSPLGDVFAKKQIDASLPLSHPVLSAFKFLKYDAIALGNHEFDFGLSTLELALSEAKIPVTSANVFKVLPSPSGQIKSQKVKSLVKNSIRVDRIFQGKELKACFFGVTPPQIMNWNKSKLEGKLDVTDGLAAAEKESTELKASGCHIVVALVHGGLDPFPYTQKSENPAWHISALKNVDAVVSGHSHLEFPSEKFKGLKNADIDKGTIHGKPVVMAGAWGSHLGKIVLTLKETHSLWSVENARAGLLPVLKEKEEPKLLKEFEGAHQETLKFIRSKIGESEVEMNSYLSMVQNSPAVDIINDAQTWFAENLLTSGQLPKLPVLSAAAPFKAGFKGEFTVLPKGTIAYKNVADLYLYPNILQIVKVTAAELKAWLEHSAEAFSVLDVSAKVPQPLFNATFPSYNFDVISGVTYKIDLSEKIGTRIKDLKYKSAPVSGEFLVVTNSYRAGGGGGFPNLGSQKIAFDSGVENREVLRQYIAKMGTIKDPTANQWMLVASKKPESSVWLDLSEKAVAPSWAINLVPVDKVSELMPGFKRYSVNFKDLPSE